MKDKKPKYKHLVSDVSNLSLGISIVVALVIGTGAGIGLKNIFDQTWLLFLGIFWGISAGVLNVYRAYKAHQRDFDEFALEQEKIDKAINKDKK